MSCNPFRRSALAAANAGFHVFPIIPNSKIPAIRDWENTATTDPAQIWRWWPGKSRKNVGLAVGRSRVVVIDLDRSKPESASSVASSGWDALRRLADRAGQVIPATASVRTPSGGVHLYFRMPDGVELRNSQGLLGPLVDTRGSGGYVLAVGSVLPSGRYVERCARDAAQIAVLPGWLTSLLLPPRPTAPSAKPRLNPPRATAYVNAIVASETATIVNAAVGTRHTTRLRAARVLGRLVGGGELDLTRARCALLEAAQTHLGTDTTAREIERDVDDGLAYGARVPRRISRLAVTSDDSGHGKASNS